MDKLQKILIELISPWFTIDQACSYSGFGKTTIRNAVKEEKLKSFRQGTATGDIRIHKKDLDAFIMFGKGHLKPGEEKQALIRNRYSNIENLKNVANELLDW
ncbi:MAG: helix-turn-helix domain-containing protein [Bacteroidetes bacterium]|nr:helix-turn-helix domain-containing protein [Bacteroidota bacterium]